MSWYSDFLAARESERNDPEYCGYCKCSPCQCDGHGNPKDSYGTCGYCGNYLMLQPDGTYDCGCDGFGHPKGWEGDDEEEDYVENESEEVVEFPKFNPIYHYPNGENDGSLEPQPCTCGAEDKEYCHCNDGSLWIELDPSGQTHIWPGTENWIHHPEWHEKSTSQPEDHHPQPRQPRRPRPMGPRPVRPPRERPTGPRPQKERG
jgi:hypothetical protein